MNYLERPINDVVALFHSNELTRLEYLDLCIAAIQQHDDRVQSIAYIDIDRARAEACAKDSLAAQGDPNALPLDGIPVGIKDIIDVAGMPTSCGVHGYRAENAQANSAVVDQLIAAGAIILGKTVTSEFASGQPGNTKNPHDLGHTPGASSSGSAAAVAAQMLPLTIGTQTNGSVVRPASFCGVYGFKLPYDPDLLKGCLPISPSLDSLGFFFRHEGDLERLYSVFYPPVADHLPTGTSYLLSGTPWDEGSVKISHWIKQNSRLESISLPAEFDQTWDCLDTIMNYELYHNINPLWGHRGDLISTKSKQNLAQGARVSNEDYHCALQRQQGLKEKFRTLFNENDIFYTPATLDAAPLCSEGTGSPVYCTLWSLLGFPAMSVPIGYNALGLPQAVQISAFNGHSLLNRTHP